MCGGNILHRRLDVSELRGGFLFGLGQHGRCCVRVVFGGNILHRRLDVSELRGGFLFTFGQHGRICVCFMCRREIL
jgi:hypothetical protein